MLTVDTESYHLPAFVERYKTLKLRTISEATCEQNKKVFNLYKYKNCKCRSLMVWNMIKKSLWLRLIVWSFLISHPLSHKGFCNSRRSRHQSNTWKSLNFPTEFFIFLPSLQNDTITWNIRSLCDTRTFPFAVFFFFIYAVELSFRLFQHWRTGFFFAELSKGIKQTLSCCSCRISLNKLKNNNWIVHFEWRINFNYIFLLSSRNRKHQWGLFVSALIKYKY